MANEPRRTNNPPSAVDFAVVQTDIGYIRKEVSDIKILITQEYAPLARVEYLEKRINFIANIGFLILTIAIGALGAAFFGLVLKK